MPIKARAKSETISNDQNSNESKKIAIIHWVSVSVIGTFDI
jgi:hypothetical protein